MNEFILLAVNVALCLLPLFAFAFYPFAKRSRIRDVAHRWQGAERVGVSGQPNNVSDVSAAGLGFQALGFALIASAFVSVLIGMIVSGSHLLLLS